VFKRTPSETGIISLGANKYQLLQRMQSIWTFTNLQYDEPKPTLTEFAEKSHLQQPKLSAVFAKRLDSIFITVVNFNVP